MCLVELLHILEIAIQPAVFLEQRIARLPDFFKDRI
jgi:hypothetical protein